MEPQVALQICIWILDNRVKWKAEPHVPSEWIKKCPIHPELKIEVGVRDDGSLSICSSNGADACEVMRQVVAVLKALGISF